MSENYGEEVPVKKLAKNDGSDGGSGSEGKQWRIIDLANKDKIGQSSRSGMPPSRRRKKKVPLKQIFNGVFNLLLIFGLGMAIYFGWAFYKNNYDGKGIFKNSGDDSNNNGTTAEDPKKDLEERVDEIKELISNNGMNGATTTEPVAIKKMLKISSNPLGFLNIRSMASTSGSIIGKAKPEEEYEYTSMENNWYSIILDEGSGWVSGEYIEVIDSPVSEFSGGEPPVISEGNEIHKIKIKETPTGYLNVRNSAWGSIIGKVYPGEEYLYTDSKDNLYFLTISDKNTGEDKSGWVLGDYIKKLQ